MKICSRISIQWNLNITNLYITKSSANENFFYPGNSQIYELKNLDITKACYSEQILAVPWALVISGFHYAALQLILTWVIKKEAYHRLRFKYIISQYSPLDQFTTSLC